MRPLKLFHTPVITEIWICRNTASNPPEIWLFDVSLIASPNGDSLGDIGLVGYPRPTRPLFLRTDVG